MTSLEIILNALAQYQWTHTSSLELVRSELSRAQAEKARQSGYGFAPPTDTWSRMYKVECMVIEASSPDKLSSFTAKFHMFNGSSTDHNPSIKDLLARIQAYGISPDADPSLQYEHIDIISEDLSRTRRDLEHSVLHLFWANKKNEPIAESDLQAQTTLSAKFDTLSERYTTALTARRLARQ